jgi:hypothetical protein
MVCALIVHCDDQLGRLPTEVDCQPVLAYACGMKPSGELGLKDFPSPHALTLPRLLLVTFWALCGGLTWIAVQKPWGKIGYGAFNLVGVILGLLITRAVLVGRLRVFFPLPLCRRGKCHKLGRDYVWRLGTLFGYETKGNYLYKCACGDIYVRQGTRFMELLPDGTRRPYKRLVGFRRWPDDSA